MSAPKTNPLIRLLPSLTDVAFLMPLALLFFRMDGAKRLLGTALNIKPVLAIIDGKIDLVTSVISKKKAMEKMLELVEKDIAGRSPVRISVFHAGIPEVAAEFQERAAARFGAVEAILSEVSPVVGSHTGPGTISIAYMAG